MTKRSFAVEVCKELPNAPNLTVAKILHKRWPQAFPNIDAARSVVRFARGALGDKKRRYAVPGVAKPLGWQTDMPECTAKVNTPLIINGKQRILILADIHFPFHDPVALKAALEYAEDFKPSIVILNGDTVEMYGISRWEPDPRRRNLAQEIEISRQGLAMIRKAFPKARIIYKLGNHDDRWEAFLIKNAAVLLDLPLTTLAAQLGLKELKMEVVQSKQIIRAGDLIVLHGHELPKGLASPVNAAKRLYDRLKQTAVCGHFHQISTHVDAMGWDKKVTSCWTTGCLCDLRPEYAITNNWTHGFATVELAADGRFTLANHSIINGVVY